MLFEVAEAIGIASFALSGFYIAIRHNLDILGIFISAFLTALGGGIVRDTIVGIDPISLTSIIPSSIVLFIIIVLLLLGFHKKENIDQKPTFVFIDAIGLVSFAIAGALVGIEHHYSITGIIILAFSTAVGGGILRDVLLNEVPYVLKGGFYGIIAIIIATIIFLLDAYATVDLMSLSIVFSCGVILRMFAYKNDWKLPTF